MGHTPLGYRIENGCAVIDEEAAERVRGGFSDFIWRAMPWRSPHKKQALRAVMLGLDESSGTGIISEMNITRRLLIRPPLIKRKKRGCEGLPLWGEYETPKHQRRFPFPWLSEVNQRNRNLRTRSGRPSMPTA